MVVGQDVQTLPAVPPDDDPRAGLLELADTRALFAPAGLAGDDVDDRGRDRLGDELEGPIDLLELLVLPRQLLVERLSPYVGAFLQLLGNGHTVDQALSRHGIQPDAFHAEWRRRIGIK